jgi:NAD(P)-dependent dehydrogenase (short-subunit alcohol dehydrogenase family)
MALQTVLITGCDQGIGFALAEQYAANQWSVIATVKDKRNAKQVRRFTQRFWELI